MGTKTTKRKNKRIEKMRFDRWKPPKMVHGIFTRWKWIPYYPQNIQIGKNVDIGVFCFLQGKNGIIIEEDVQIGSHCSIYSEDTERGISGKIIIKKGIKIGAHSVILPKKNEDHVIDKNIKAGSVVY